MSQKNTNTNNGAGNANRNQITRRGKWGQGGSGGRGRGGRGGNCRDSSTTKYLFEGEMIDGCISKLTITKLGHQTTQYKKIINTLSILCADKNFRCINDVLCKWTDLPEAMLLLP